MSYLNFMAVGTSESGETKIWTVQTLDGIGLGEISWFSAWRKYTFFPEAGTTFDPSCLREIATYIEAETVRHKLTESKPVAPKRRSNCF